MFYQFTHEAHMEYLKALRDGFDLPPAREIIEILTDPEHLQEIITFSSANRQISFDQYDIEGTDGY